MILQTIWNECVRFGVHVKHTSYLQDLMVGNTKEGSNLAQSKLLSRGVVLRQLWSQRGLGV